MRTYTINGIVAHAEEINDEHGTIEGYRVVVDGEYVGNRIERVPTGDGSEAMFQSIARNERIIDWRMTLRDAIADVLNDGMRDRTRR